MLHIILGILKLAGLLIGIVLLLLFAAALAVLLVPVRYQARAAKTRQELEADVRISWLLHLVSLLITVRNGSRPQVTIRLFGRPLSSFLRKKNRRRKAESSTEPSDRKKRAGRDRAAESRKRKAKEETADGGKRQMAEEAEDGRKRQTAEEAADGGKSQTVEEAANGGKRQTAEEAADGEKRLIAEEKPSEKTGQSTETKKADGQMAGECGPAENRRTDGGLRADGQPTDFRRADQEAENGKTAFMDRIRFRVSRFCDTIRQRWDRIRGAVQSLGRIPQRLGRIKARLARLRQRPEQFMEFWETWEIERILKKLQRELVFLLRHYGPRRIRGYLSFGTGDPALTGQLTGLVYLILPARAEQFQVQPDFYEARLETELVCSGHIRGVHALCTLVRLLMDARVRGLIRERLR